ncbi:MAG: response regulator [Tepidisphaeraceae bacterium]|jgi:putative two-component system response regulator
MNALIVDDDEISCEVVANALQQLGHTVQIARNGREGLEMLRTETARLVITDWEMPEMNGIELCRAIRKEDFTGYIYIIMLTSRQGEREEMEGMDAGADDFLHKPLKPSELLVCLKTAERILSLETRDLAMFAMAKLAESRDPETGAHIERVQSFARVLAQNLSSQEDHRATVGGDFIRLIYQTSPLHDIGKVGIPDRVLLKPGKLDANEYSLMKTHADLGAQTLDAALQRFPNAKFLHMARDIALNHHEKWDGSGYPKGLAREQIPLCARIVALADVYDALTSRRIYKEAISHHEAKSVICAESGRHFDPAVVKAFLAAEQEFIAIKESLGEQKIERRSTPPAAPITPGEPFKILVVEDNPGQLEFLADFLNSTDHELLTASDGAEALRLFEEHSPRVVISDWNMPGMSGLELCRKIRAARNGKYVHFVMLTVRTDQANIIEAFDAGVDDFVAKPFNQQELLARVRAGLRSAWLHDELARKNEGSVQINLQLARLNESLQKAAATDELTGLPNRRSALSRLDEQLELADRYSGSLAVAIVDVDHFKTINDTFGHDAGDIVLKEISRILLSSVRATDSVGRVGGEEFLLIFPARTAQEAAVCAERCRTAVESHVFTFNGAETRITISIGVAGRKSGTVERSELLKAADTALYAAKHAGRNNVNLGESDLNNPAPAIQQKKLAS